MLFNDEKIEKKIFQWVLLIVAEDMRIKKMFILIFLNVTHKFTKKSFDSTTAKILKSCIFN